MYKTIRHGENSLQYTILPQTDDFRLEGRIRSVGSGKRSGPLINGITRPRSRARRTFFAYLGVLFICTILIGAVLIPFLVSTECLPNPTEWFLRTKAALMHRGLELAFVGNNNNSSILAINPSNTNQSQVLPESIITDITTTTMIETEMSPNNRTSVKQILDTSNVPSKVTDSMATSNTIISTIIPLLMMDDNSQSSPPPEISLQSIVKMQKTKSISTNPTTIPIISSPSNMLVTTQHTTVVLTTETIDKTLSEHQRNIAWIQGHWPYIDPSTYFQWNVSHIIAIQCLSI